MRLGYHDRGILTCRCAPLKRTLSSYRPVGDIHGLPSGPRGWREGKAAWKVGESKESRRKERSGRRSCVSENARERRQSMHKASNRPRPAGQCPPGGDPTISWHSPGLRLAGAKQPQLPSAQPTARASHQDHCKKTIKTSISSDSNGRIKFT